MSNNLYCTLCRHECRTTVMAKKGYVSVKSCTCISKHPSKVEVLQYLLQRKVNSDPEACRLLLEVLQGAD